MLFQEFVVVPSKHGTLKTECPQMDTIQENVPVVHLVLVEFFKFNNDFTIKKLRGHMNVF